MNHAAIKDAIECLKMNSSAIADGSDTMTFCKVHGLYSTLEELREIGKQDRAVKQVAKHLAVIFHYRGKVIFLERLELVIGDLESLLRRPGLYSAEHPCIAGSTAINITQERLSLIERTRRLKK